MTSDFILKPYHWGFALCIALLLHAIVFVSLKSMESGESINNIESDNELVISFKKLKQLSLVESTSLPEVTSKPKVVTKVRPEPVTPKPNIKKVVKKEKTVIQPSVKATIKPKVARLNNASNAAKPTLSQTRNYVDKTQSKQNIAKHGEQLRQLDLANSKDKDRYLSQLVTWLAKHKKYPSIARRRNLQGSVLIRFKINKEGHLLSYSVVQSSPHNSLNSAAIKMIERASPLPKVPASLLEGNDEFEYTIPVEFSLTSK